MEGDPHTADLDERQRDDLVAAALRAMELAYAPYSRFKVGAAVRVLDGIIFDGCNIENASYGLTICAERTAIFAAVSAGHRTITHVVVASESHPPAAPCGACRQVIREFGPEALIVAVNLSGEQWWSTIDALLPSSFGPGDLSSTQ